MTVRELILRLAQFRDSNMQVEILTGLDEHGTPEYTSVGQATIKSEEAFNFTTYIVRLEA